MSGSLAWRDRLVERIEVLTGADLEEQAAAAGIAEPDIVSHWKRAGEIVSLPYRGAEVFPAFQFWDARPNTVVAAVLRALPAAYSSAQIVQWFTTRNPVLGERAPIDMIDDSDAVLRAALLAEGRAGA
jgi:hypothetical protein